MIRLDFLTSGSIFLAWHSSPHTGAQYSAIELDSDIAVVLRISRFVPQLEFDSFSTMLFFVATLAFTLLTCSFIPILAGLSRITLKARGGGAFRPPYDLGSLWSDFK